MSRHDERYARIYRKLHPKDFPLSPYERQLELSDLWESDQEKFKQFVDAIDADHENELRRLWKATP